MNSLWHSHDYVLLTFINLICLCSRCKVNMISVFCQSVRRQVRRQTAAPELDLNSNKVFSGWNPFLLLLSFIQTKCSFDWWCFVVFMLMHKLKEPWGNLDQAVNVVSGDHSVCEAVQVFLVSDKSPKWVIINKINDEKTWSEQSYGVCSRRLFYNNKTKRNSGSKADGCCHCLLFSSRSCFNRFEPWLQQLFVCTQQIRIMWSQPVTTAAARCCSRLLHMTSKS